MREAVLAWMRETGATVAEAAEKFGQKASTIRQWQTRDRRNATSGSDNTVTPVASRVAPRARGKPSLADVRPNDRARILGFKDRVLDHIDSEDVLKDTRKVRDLVSALVQLSSAISDLLTLDERMKAVEAASEPGTGPDGGEDADRRLQEALEGGDPPSPE